MTTPATPPPAPPADTFMTDMLASIGRVVTPDGQITQAPPPAAPEPGKEPEPPAAQVTSVSLAETVAENARLAEEEKKNPKPPVTPPPVTPPVTPPPPAPAPALRKKTEAAPVAPAPVPPPVAAAPPVTPPPATPPADPDATYIENLTQDQRDELELAAFAETKDTALKGQRKKTIEFFKKVDDFVTKNPGTSPDSDEFKEFVVLNKPALPGRRKLENTLIADQAAASARKQVMEEVQPEINAQKAKLRQQEVAPIIQQASERFQDFVASPESVADPATMEALPKEVGSILTKDGYAAALKQYPIEAPIFAAATNAATEWLRLTNGVSQFNENNPTHKWLVDFVGNQGRIYAANPASTRDGKRFLPLNDYLALASTNPQEADKCYTFDDQQVLNMIGVNANLQLNNQLRTLEAAGFKREKKNPVPKVENNPPVVPPVTTPPATPPPASPRLTTSTMPGAANTAPSKGENAKFLDSLVPGISDRLRV